MLVGCADDPGERIETVYELKADPSAQNVEAMRGYLADEDPQVRVTAMYQLVELGVPDAKELALESLEDSSAFVRMMAAQQLGRFSEERVSLALGVRATTDEDARVRRRAALSLAEVGGPSSGATLGRCAVDPDAGVREVCVEGVARLDPSSHVPTLVRLLSDDPEWKVRVQAARALGLSGDRSATPDLEAATQDVNEFVRGAARHALERLSSAPSPPRARGTETGSSDPP